MSRPLVISDCDEVLLHMIAPFRVWLGETQGVTFRMEGNNFAHAMRWTDSGEVVEPDKIWQLLGQFFTTEMDRQSPIAGAVAAMRTLAEVADVVVLTNLGDEHRERRTAQLLAAPHPRRVPPLARRLHRRHRAASQFGGRAFARGDPPAFLRRTRTGPAHRLRARRRPRRCPDRHLVRGAAVAAGAN